MSLQSECCYYFGFGFTVNGAINHTKPEASIFVLIVEE